jgi:hypothetical protein
MSKSNYDPRFPPEAELLADEVFGEVGEEGIEPVHATILDDESQDDIVEPIPEEPLSEEPVSEEPVSGTEEPVSGTVVEEPIESATDYEESPTDDLIFIGSTVDEAAGRFSESVELHDSNDLHETHEVAIEPARMRSFPFRVVDLGVSVIGWCFGFASLLIGLAVIAVIPVVQILSLGYFLEVCGRIGRTGRVREGFIGIRKAARVGSLVAGTWIMLLPIRYVSAVWYAAYLIDPSSPNTRILRVVQLVLTVLIISHIVAAWYCGGRFRHFFWPVVAPFSVMIWVMRYIAATPYLRKILNETAGAISPRFVEDFCNVKPITDWFLPAILIKGLVTGRLFSKACDGLWDFVSSLRIKYYFWLGFRGLLGSIAWLIVPASLLMGATTLTNGPAVLCGLFGVLSMSVVIIYLPFAQAHFAAEGKWSALFNISAIRHAFVRAPLRYWFSLLILLAFAIPLFLFQIEKTYEELEWMESLFFIALMLPARFLVGWAYARGRHREQKSIWPLTWATRFAQIPIVLTFVFFLFVSRYISMNGVWSIYEQPAFLIPAPFTEWLF